MTARRPEPPATPLSVDDRSRARWPGTGVAAVVALTGLVLAGCGTGSGAAASGTTGGVPTSTTAGGGGSGYPAFLPKKTLDPRVDAALVGTEARPALQVEGLPVDVRTPAFDVRVTVSGPVVPGEGLAHQNEATTCTWTVKLDHATADVPVSLAEFHTVDHLGSVYLLGLVPGESPPPPVLHPGQSLTFRLRAYELIGEGQMQWAPDRKHIVADFDYSVEND